MNTNYGGHSINVCEAHENLKKGDFKMNRV